MPIGGRNSSAINDEQIPVIVAAGNGNRGGREQDECGYSPAGADRSYTIGATTQNDSKTS